MAGYGVHIPDLALELCGLLPSIGIQTNNKAQLKACTALVNSVLMGCKGDHTNGKRRAGV